VPILVEGEVEAHDSARDFDVGTARVFVSSRGDGDALMDSIPGELLVMGSFAAVTIDREGRKRAIALELYRVSGLYRQQLCQL
jgi:hypothetical protein